jgi:hypothetical protein
MDPLEVEQLRNHRRRDFRREYLIAVLADQKYGTNEAEAALARWKYAMHLAGQSARSIERQVASPTQKPPVSLTVLLTLNTPDRR